MDKWFHPRYTNNWIWSTDDIELEVVRNGAKYVVWIVEKATGKVFTLKRGNKQAQWSSPYYAQRKALQFGLNPKYRKEV